MIELLVNGESKSVAIGSDVSQALQAWGYDMADKIAVAVNGEFVPRSRYQQRILVVDDKIDVVSPISGG